MCFPPAGCHFSRAVIYLRIPRPHVHYEANQEEHDEDEETDSGNLSCGKSHKSKPKGTRYQRNQKENQGVIPESGVKTTSSGLERLQPVDLAEYVADEVS